MSEAASNVVEMTLEKPLEETADWLAIRSAAIEGFAVQIAIEQEGMRTDERLQLFSYVEERKARISSLLRALERARAWRPLSEIPRRR